MLKDPSAGAKRRLGAGDILTRVAPKTPQNIRI